MPSLHLRDFPILLSVDWFILLGKIAKFMTWYKAFSQLALFACASGEHVSQDASLHLENLEDNMSAQNTHANSPLPLHARTIYNVKGALYCGQPWVDLIRPDHFLPAFRKVLLLIGKPIVENRDQKMLGREISDLEENSINFWDLFQVLQKNILWDFDIWHLPPPSQPPFN